MCSILFPLNFRHIRLNLRHLLRYADFFVVTKYKIIHNLVSLDSVCVCPTLCLAMHKWMEWKLKTSFWIYRFRIIWEKVSLAHSFHQYPTESQKNYYKWNNINSIAYSILIYFGSTSNENGSEYWISDERLFYYILCEWLLIERMYTNDCNK